MAKIVIPYTPRPLQRQFHEQRTRFCVLLCHRRFGKTVAAINDLVRQALRSGKADWRAAYAAPFYSQAKSVAWDYLKFYAGPVPGVKFNESELRCDFPNGARIRLFGTDNANALRGMYLDDLVLDEPADMVRSVWTQVLRPMLADRQGRALFCGTPHGTENLLYDVWQQAGEDESGLWSRFRFPASETGYLDATELAAARRAMDAAEYEQEFECSFAAAVRGAYYADLVDAAEQEGRVCAVPVDPALPVNTAWDLGMDDATSIWLFQIAPGGEWRMVDYYEASGEPLAHYARVLQDKGHIYGEHIAPHDIRVRELGTGKSRLEVAADLGIRFSVAPQLRVEDGIDAVRRKLPLCRFDASKCAAGLKALRFYRREWREDHQVYAMRPRHDWTSHGADAMRYAVTGYRGMADIAHAPRTANTRYDMWGYR